MDELSDRLRDLSQPDIEPRIYNTRSIDARLVIDVLYNDLDEVIEEIISANTNN